MIGITELKEQVREVRGARLRLEAAQIVKKQAVTEWEASNTGILQEVNLANAEVSETEAKLKDMTLQVYNETGEKKPVAGVEVKIFSRSQYDPDQAKGWCLEHKVALKFDVPTFEKLAKVENLSFVEIIEEPRVQIATDLSAVLKVD